MKNKSLENKQKILGNIRAALEQKTPKPYPELELPKSFYAEAEETLDMLFIQRFTNLSGQFIYCEDESDFLSNFMALADQKKLEYIYCWDEELQQLFQNIDFRKCRIGRNLDKAHAGLTFCEALIAQTGSIVVSSGLAAGRQLPIFPPIHLVIGYTSQLVYSIDKALNLLQSKYGQYQPSFVSVISGPSRTADIEKTLVLGAHGPKEVYLFLIEDAV